MNQLTLWNEKYRPKKLNEIIHQNETILVIKNLIDNHNLPHLIFYGPPGTGKTSTILAVCNEIFPDEIKYNRCFEFNASNDRGIKFIREKIKKISNQKIKNYPNTPHIKIIILDEVDTLTTDSQYALRRIMENSSSNTRFCLICNYPNKLIEPIISRCAQFRFKPIPTKIMEEKLTDILKQEKIKNKKDITNLIIENSYGDLRLSISYLQRYYKYNESLNKIYGIIGTKELLSFIQLYNNEIKFWDKIKEFIQKKYHLAFQIKTLLELVSKLNIDDIIKINLIEDLSEMDYYIINGVNNTILWNFLGVSLLKNLT
ncbi:putative replication factor C subunit [Cafeteria roenbergensis virus]|uniref:Putative replication factor C subunit n=1 Tax=Cafeteria roenbergensis virus (strain BV-PW1) TaxID=693272 RepID=E3T4W5_CROVB|nr:clamp loader of DNA polymerase [Cafeteria roenbergensis virus BV-PW1]ADO67228.1 putative replication factor C subunit [Cafeteria roenbergensis virus BV-PW1]